MSRTQNYKATNYKAERKSMKCPICFCNNLTLCTHSSILKKNTGYAEPFIGCYNKIVYKDIKIPNDFLTSYDQFILKQLDEFPLRFIANKPSSWENYRLELMAFFYLPIVNFAKEKGLLPKDFVLSIKGETFVADEEDTDSVDLGAPVVGDDEQQLPSSPNIVINISVNTSSGSNRQSLFQPLYKKTAINKNTKKPNIQVTCQTSSQVATQQVVVVDENIKQSSLMVLNLEDFATLQSFHQALRREMCLDDEFTFHNLRFKIAQVHDHSINVKGCEMKVLSQFVQDGRYDTIEFKYGN